MKTMGGAAGQLGDVKASPSNAKPAVKKGGKATVKEIRIKRGHAGGYIVRNHVDKADGGYEEQEFPMGKLGHVVKHLKTHMPAQKDEAEMPGETPENC